LDIHNPIEEIKAELIYILFNDMANFFDEEAIEAIRTWGFVSGKPFDHIINILPGEWGLNMMKIMLLHKILDVEKHVGLNRATQSNLVLFPKQGSFSMMVSHCSTIQGVKTCNCVEPVALSSCSMKEFCTFISKLSLSYCVSFPSIFFLILQ
jgi:hypothetical protein